MASVNLRINSKPVACPAFPLVRRKTIRHASSRGQANSYARRIGSRTPRQYEVQFENATPGQEREVRLAWQEAGMTKSLNWLNPGQEDQGIVEVVFVEDTLRVQQTAHNVYDIRFELQEVIR